MKRVQFVGLDVHADTIAVAVAEPGGAVRSVGVIPNRPESIRKLVKRLGPEQLRVCYEAGPTGYVIYWQLTALGVRCEVVAPTLVPVQAGDRVRTDRRDAQKLARSYRAGDLTPVWVPDAAHEALRDVVRAREAAKKDQLRARHRLGKFLLRHGRRPPTGINRWTQRHLLWVKGVRFAEAAQEATLLDYLHEVEHMADRLTRLEAALDEAVQAAPAPMLGDRDDGGNRGGAYAARRRIARRRTGYAMAVAVERHTKRRTLVAFYAAGLRAGSARLVRGSSRRMTTMRCRPAYIRVINRRKSLSIATMGLPRFGGRVNAFGHIVSCRAGVSPVGAVGNGRSPFHGTCGRVLGVHRPGSFHRGLRHRLRTMPLFEVQRRVIRERRMTPLGVVPPVDEVEHRRAGVEWRRGT